MMTSIQSELQELAGRAYKYGFVTNPETDAVSCVSETQENVSEAQVKTAPRSRAARG